MTDLLGREEIDIVINATVPAAHAEVSLAVLRAGKHAYSEKPLGTERAEGERILREAAAAGLRVGCAPDAIWAGAIRRRAAPSTLA